MALVLFSMHFVVASFPFTGLDGMSAGTGHRRLSQGYVSMALGCSKLLSIDGRHNRRNRAGHLRDKKQSVNCCDGHIEFLPYGPVLCGATPTLARMDSWCLRSENGPRMGPAGGKLPVTWWPAMLSTRHQCPHTAPPAAGGRKKKLHGPYRAADI